jgi:hypothetical protein
MASQPIGTCRHAYDVGNTAHTELDYAIDSMVDQMNNWPQGTNYYYYKISSSTQPTPQPHECAGEVDYIKKCLQQLYDAGEVVDGTLGSLSTAGKITVMDMEEFLMTSLVPISHSGAHASFTPRAISLRTQLK